MNIITEDKVLYETVIEGGWNFSHIIRRGRGVRLTDIEGGANVSALFYNKDNYTERYNMGDTLKIQHISSLMTGNCIYSDMGRILMSIIDSSLNWHDVISGVSDAAFIAQTFGENSYQEARNEFYRNGYDSLLGELAKYGMGRRDFTCVVNFFSKIAVAEDGALSFVEKHSKAGDYIDLRAEMDTLLVLDCGMNPLNTAQEYQRKPVKLTIFECPPATFDDQCRNSCPENVRGFINTQNYYI